MEKITFTLEEVEGEPEPLTCARCHARSTGEPGSVWGNISASGGGYTPDDTRTYAFHMLCEACWFIGCEALGLDPTMRECDPTPYPPESTPPPVCLVPPGAHGGDG